MRIFVAGGTGVIGRRLVPQLVARGHSVIAAARSHSKAAALSAQGAVPIVVDLFDAAAVRRAVGDVEAIINMATSVPPSSRALLPGAWREMRRVRRAVSRNLYQAALAGGAGRFIQESFAPIYADARDRWIDETSLVRPARYNRAVMDAEHVAERFAGAGKVGIVLRFGFFYGPDSDFFLDALRMARKGRAALLGEPDGYTSQVSHDDAAAAVGAALDAPAGVYNIVDDEPLTKRELARTIASALRAPPPRFFPVWLSHLAGSLGETLARSQRISNAKFRGVTSWRPRYPSARVGVPATIAGITRARDA